jgi:hypothetical protein
VEILVRIEPHERGRCLFTMAVEVTLEIKGRRTASGGTLLAGYLKTGEKVVIEVEGTAPRVAFLHPATCDRPARPASKSLPPRRNRFILRCVR